MQAEFDGLTEHKGTIGNANAKVTITEFGDLRCPICKTFDNKVAPQVISDIVRPGTAKLQYKTWPILGPELGRRGQGGLRGASSRTSSGATRR